MDDTSADQGADLNQSSGIFGEEKKGIFAQIGEKFGGFFRGIARTLGKIAVEKKSPDDENFDDGKSDDDNGNFESTSKHKNISEPANSVDSSFVGPMNRNIFTDKDAAASLVRHEAEMSEIEGVSEPDAENNTNRSINNQSISPEDLPEIFYPETTEDLVWLINKLPEEVISKQQRRTMAAAMTFDSKLVKEVMTPKNEVIIIHENDFMGPLTLSRLYLRFVESIISCVPHKHIEQNWDALIIMRLKLETRNPQYKFRIFIEDSIEEKLIFPCLVAVIDQTGTPKRVHEAQELLLRTNNLEPTKLAERILCRFIY